MKTLKTVQKIAVRAGPSLENHQSWRAENSLFISLQASRRGWEWQVGVEGAMVGGGLCGQVWEVGDECGWGNRTVSCLGMRGGGAGVILSNGRLHTLPFYSIFANL